MKPSFGVRIPCAGALAGPDNMRDAAQEAERRGFDSLWVHDYIIWTKALDRIHISCGSREAVNAAGPDYPPMFYESISNLAFLAGVTSTIKLGLGVLVLPYREPVVTAKQLATIDALSKGRLILGVGQGAAKSTQNVDFEVLGISRADKVARTREYLEAMQRIWSEDSPSLHGTYAKFDDATIYPKPVQQPHPPIWIGGQADKSLEMIADYADGWLSFWISPEQFPRAIAEVHRRLEQRGRNPQDFEVGTEIQIYLAETTERARKEATPTLLAFEEGYAGTTGGFAESAGSADTLQEIWNSSLIGSPADVAAQMHKYVESGCTFFELKFIYRDLPHLFDQLAAFSEEIMPKLR
ncbi:MAG TPA: LLM class flavin-dependent oxidoreductase [Streptosporangiaceae bacterium]|nr:LLM class flavin-dependent oxidoreductase [Streptosporangiaceae bacterium]